MTFAHPGLLWLLPAVLPAMLLFFWWSARERRRLRAQFIQARLLPGLVSGLSPGREKFRAASLIFAAACLILALARPQWGYEQQEVRQRGLDIVVGIDTSKSMLAEDIPPNRLARAKLAALDLVQLAKSDRLGIVAFAGTAFLQCPLTIDDSAFRRSLESLNVNTLPVGGTALAGAIETASKAFQKGDNFKVLVLFTDGEDHDTGAIAAAEKAAEAGLRIYTIGIGSAEGELLRIPTANGQTDYARDRGGNVVKSRLNEPLLRDIAGAARGFYLPLRGARTMEALYQQGLAPLPKAETQEKWVRRARERYHWPLALAILAIAFEFLFPERKSDSTRSRSAPSRTPAVARAAILLLVIAPIAVSASTSRALREYRSGNYEEALREYERSLEKESDDPRLNFNAGTAAYRKGQFDKAAEHFSKALESPDLALQEQAYYNLGNTLFRLGQQAADPSKKTESWQEALKKYESSLKLDTADADARFNHDYVQKRLEELKQQQQQQQNQQNQQDQNQDQGQSNQQQQQGGQEQAGDQQQEQQEQQQGNQGQAQQETGNQDQQSQQSNSQQGEEPQPQNQQQQQKQAAGEDQRPSTEQGEQAATGGIEAGEMTPAEAERLLDAQKGNEKVLPVPPQPGNGNRRRPEKDW